MDVETSATSGVKRKADLISGGPAADGIVRKQRADEDAAATRAKPSFAIVSSGSNAFNEQYLRYFYAKLFPFKQMFRWLSYGNDPDSLSDSELLVRDYFHRREFCFTMADDVFIRYQCFRDADEFAKAVQAKQPYKIDIGPVMNVKPSMHATVKKVEYLERELVFDIDMDAYDDIRYCCKGATICKKCWSFINVAVRVIDQVLQEDFGFKHILFVYSGRRGMHCWVGDKEARRLENGQRGAVVEYMAALTGNGSAVDSGSGDKGAPSVAKTASGLTIPLHPALVRAYRELEPIFEEWIISEEGQGLLATPDKWARVLELIPILPEGEHVPLVREAVREAWERASTPVQRWRQLRKTVEQCVEMSGGSTAGPGAGIFGKIGAGLMANTRASEGVKFRLPFGARVQLEKLIPAIVFTFTYPRLDIEVSKTMNHLLKAPFCVHPKTGKVCVPIDPTDIDNFDPEAVPTVAQLVAEGTIYARTLAASGAGAGAGVASGGGGDGEDGDEGMGRRGGDTDIVSHTSLKKYILKFEEFVRECELSATRERREASDKAGRYGDF